MKRYSIYYLFFWLFCGSASASAEVLDFTFSGQIFRVGSDLGTQVQSGDAYTFSVSYDSEAPLDSNVPTSGSYPAISMELEISTSTGPLRVVFDSPRIELESQSTYQRVTFASAGLTDSFKLNGRELFNPLVTMFSSEDPLPHDGLGLPTTFNRADYSSNSSSSQLSLAFGDGFSEELIKGDIDSISTSGAQEPALPTSLADATARDEGWYSTPWFGYFSPLGDGWIYHSKLGFLYTLGDDASSIFFWDSALNRWLWTSSSQYPWMYAFGPEGGWVFFFENSRPGSRYFGRGGADEVLFENQLRADASDPQ